MSNSVTNVEIEDVLSSIRRLVSEDTRPKTQNDTLGEGKLVLTPADRIPDVDDATAPAQEAPTQAVAENHGDEPAPKAPEPMTIETRIAELEEAVNDQVDEWEPDGSEEMPANDDVASKVPSFMHRAAQDTGAVQDAYVYDEGPHEVAQDDAAPVSAESEAQADQPGTLSQGDHQTDDPHDLTADSTPKAEEQSAFDHHGAHEAEPQPDAEALPDADTIEDVVPAEDPQPQVDSGADTGPAQEPTILRSQEAEDALEAALSDDVEDAAYLDEETIRDMVREIVREELQGVLGERITRNVRKLVRREIHRAMTSSELE